MLRKFKPNPSVHDSGIKYIPKLSLMTLKNREIQYKTSCKPKYRKINEHANVEIAYKITKHIYI